ncbi:hypothetical protein F0562_005647 [Nyssa sinensis]|uniref:Uncharacterized protein n=1 Tax=Nyssa sinensis TaxID=561372 RepID=A0A5J5AKV2_9ASTE|nr:hypothetical protein F0562_005647 [Nyssa sinensis]
MALIEVSLLRIRLMPAVLVFSLFVLSAGPRVPHYKWEVKFDYKLIEDKVSISVFGEFAEARVRRCKWEVKYDYKLIQHKVSIYIFGEFAEARVRHYKWEAHFAMGMGVVFEEGIEKVGKLPTSIMGSGATKGIPRP